MRKIKAIIDSGATGSYMSRKLVLEEGWATIVKPRPYFIITMDGSPLGSGSINAEIIPQIITTKRGHVERISFNVVNIDYQLILGMPWIR